MAFWIVLTCWIIINIADEWTSQLSTHYPGLVEEDPLARDPKTKKYSLRRGIAEKMIALDVIILLHIFFAKDYAGAIVAGIHSAAVLYAVVSNIFLIREARKQ